MQNNEQEPELTPDQTARLAAFRVKLARACHHDRALQRLALKEVEQQSADRLAA